jgi:hypothetical protein
VVSPVNKVVAPATQFTCLQLPTSDALTRSGDSGGHIQRGISRILRARAYLDLLAFYIPFPPDHMRVISGTGHGALALFFASHESSLKVPSDFYMMAAHGCLASLRSAPLMFGSALGTMRLPHSLVGLDLRRRYRAPLCRVSIQHMLCLWTASPGARALGTTPNSTTGLSTCLNKSLCLKRGLLTGGTCGWRSAVFGRELNEIVHGMLFG